MSIPKTKQYCVVTRGLLGGEKKTYYYAINEAHAIHCYYAHNPFAMDLPGHIKDIYEQPPHPAFQFEKKDSPPCQ